MTFYKGKPVEIVNERGTLTEIRYEGDPEHKTFSVLTKDLTLHSVKPAAHRLGCKADSVLSAMSCGDWFSLEDLSRLSGYESLTGLSACLRAFRKPENGSRVIEKRKQTDGVFEYRLGL